MRRIFPILLAVFMFSCSARKTQVAHPKTVMISSKGSTGTNEFQLRIKEIISDSRCPADVTCVWGGEVQLVVSVYKDKKLAEAMPLTIRSILLKENAAWFSKYAPGTIKRIVVLPDYRQDDKRELKDYKIEIQYD